MNILQTLINSLNKEEVRHLKLFLNRTASNADRKDILLFDALRKAKPQSEEALVAKLYGKSNKNAFYRLKNRLVEDIGKSLAVQHFQSEEQGLIQHHLNLSRQFQIKQHYELAYYYLNKAERRASKLQHYDVLELIYTDFIKLSHESLSVNPEEYIKKRKENREKLTRIHEIDDILAALIYRIKTLATYGTKQQDILDLLQKTVDDFADDKDLKDSPVLRFKIYHAVSRILLQHHDYEALEVYLLETLEAFKREGLFKKANHDTKLQMLVYLANSLFKNGKLKLALSYIEQLKTAMDEFGGFLHDKYLIYYYNALVNNYSELDKRKALDILDEAAEHPVIQRNTMYEVVLKGQIAQLHFDLGNYKNANRSLIQMKLADGFENLDEGFKLKTNIAELLIRFELEDFDFIELRLKQFPKEFDGILKQKEFLEQKRMLTILDKLIVTPNISSDPELVQRFEVLFNESKAQDGEASVLINFLEWFRSKFRNR